MVDRRRRIESGVRLRPRRGLVVSRASRYWRTMRPSSRPLANAALWASDMGVFLRDFVELAAAMGRASQSYPYGANGSSRLRFTRRTFRADLDHQGSIRPDLAGNARDVFFRGDAPGDGPFAGPVRSQGRSFAGAPLTIPVSCTRGPGCTRPLGSR